MTTETKQHEIFKGRYVKCPDDPEKGQEVLELLITLGYEPVRGEGDDTTFYYGKCVALGKYSDRLTTQSANSWEGLGYNYTEISIEELREAAYPSEKQEESAPNIQDLFEYINEVLIDARVDYPAGREAGHAIHYDDDEMEEAVKAYVDRVVEYQLKEGISNNDVQKINGMSCDKVWFDDLKEDAKKVHIGDVWRELPSLVFSTPPSVGSHSFYQELEKERNKSIQEYLDKGWKLTQNNYTNINKEGETTMKNIKLENVQHLMFEDSLGHKTSIPVTDIQDHHLLSYVEGLQKAIDTLEGNGMAETKRSQKRIQELKEGIKLLQSVYDDRDSECEDEEGEEV